MPNEIRVFLQIQGKIVPANFVVIIEHPKVPKKVSAEFVQTINELPRPDDIYQ